MSPVRRALLPTSRYFEFGGDAESAAREQTREAERDAGLDAACDECAAEHAVDASEHVERLSMLLSLPDVSVSEVLEATARCYSASIEEGGRSRSWVP